MDSERRHELQHNALDSELSKVWAFIRSNGNQIFWTIIIIATILLAVVFTRNKIRNRNMREAREYAVLTSAANPVPRFEWRRIDWRQADWDQLTGCYPFKGMLARMLMEQENAVLAAEGVAPVAINYPRLQERAYGGDLPKIEDEINQLVAFAGTAHDDRLAGMALVTAGDLRLTQYLLALNPNDAALDAASQLYQQALSDYADDGLVVGKAQLGLAKVAENRWTFDAADQAYAAVLATPGNEGTPAALAADIGRNRIEEMRGMTALSISPIINDAWPSDPDADWAPDLDADLTPPVGQ
jgi:hypothetical protein